MHTISRVNLYRKSLARMAELVDASVSKTDEVTLVPVQARLWVQKKNTSIRRCFFYSIFFWKSYSNRGVKAAAKAL